MDLSSLKKTLQEYIQKTEKFIVVAPDYAKYGSQVISAKIRRIGKTEVSLFAAACGFFGFFVGLSSPRKCRKLKVFAFLTAVAGITALIYRLLTDND